MLEKLTVPIPLDVKVFIGTTLEGKENEPYLVKSWADFSRTFGVDDDWKKFPIQPMVYIQLMEKFNRHVYVVKIPSAKDEDVIGDKAQKTGLYSVETIKGANTAIVCDKISVEVATYISHHFAEKSDRFFMIPNVDW